MYTSSLETKIKEYVPSSGEHIDTSCVCSHKVGTFDKSPINWVIFNKDNKTFRRVGDIYYFKGLTFQLKEGKLISDEVTITLPTRTSITTVERLVLSLGFNISNVDVDTVIDISQTDFRKILQTLTALALIDLSIVSKNFNQKKKMKYGEVIFEAYLKVVNGSGRVKAKNHSMRWLNDVDTLKLKSKMFDESGYQVGVNSKEYIYTEFAHNIFKTVFELLKVVDFKDIKVNTQPLDFIVSIDLLSDIKLRDVMLLLSNCIGFNNGFIIRPKLIDKHQSRVYSIFTSISSDTRGKLGFTNYDIGSALQTICLQLIDYITSYPLHQELADNKIRFRSQVMKETGQDLQWVKKELSKINNLKEEMPLKYKKYPLLEKYFNEAMILRKEIISTAESGILQNANNHAKPNWEKVWIKDKIEPEFVQSGKKDSSVFFFIWTQWERQIRECMMSCFNNAEACHQVHDAVYSRQIIKPKLIEQKVFNETGFKLQISTN